MSDFKVRDIGVFNELVRGIERLEHETPSVFDSVLDALETLLRDVFVNIKETKQELIDINQEITEASRSASAGGDPNAQATVNELAGRQSHMQSRLQALESAEAQLSHLQLRFNSTMQYFNSVLTRCGMAKNSLLKFDQLARAYLNLGTHGSIGHGSNSSSVGHGNAGIDLKDIRSVGDTFHYTKQEQITQMDIDRLEQQIKNSTHKGDKISIDKVSQSDFSLLEKNGYTIQKIGPNDYSAHKNIER